MLAIIKKKQQQENLKHWYTVADADIAPAISDISMHGTEFMDHMRD